MNLIQTFQDLVARVPELVQPLIIALAGAVPFIEGEMAATIGILGGVPPVIAAIAAMAGNFLCVAILVGASARTRAAVVARRARVSVAVGSGASADAVADSILQEEEGGARSTARKQKFQRAFERYGVPGVSLLGPLLLPTQFTATMLAAIGIRPARILVWQAVAIIGWTTVLSLVATGLVQVAG